jgi:serine/threonine-protein kinase
MGGDAPEVKRIGRYDIVNVLGEGAMGVVYEGLDTRLHRKVAIKRILKSALDSDSAKEYSARFAREAQAVARLNHPNIVQVFDFAEEGDVAYIVMEFVRGKELKTFFDARERFALKEVVHIMGELCEALHFAHGAGVIHRDIKPANVMIDHEGRVKLTDFGVARFTDPDRTQSDKTQAGAIVGTPAYMSPEQIQGEPLDRRTDIFSAGIILYEFLTGGKPFTGQGAWTIAKKILQDEPPAPSTVDKTIAPVYDAIVAKALAKRIDARYQSARDLGMALKRALEGLPEIDEAEKTVILAPGALKGVAPEAGEKTVPLTQPKAVELEFWRSIKDGNDPADFDLYLQQFPSGIYAALARRKISKLKGAPGDETVVSTEVEKKEVEEAARRENEARAKLAAEKSELEARLARREAEMAKREEELSKRAADAEKLAAAAPRRSPVAPVLATLAAAGAIALAWFSLRPPDPLEQRVAQLTRMLEESKQREAELVQARAREAELVKELELVRQRAAEAEKAGDVARQRELAEQLRQREAEARKQAELVRQREAEQRKLDQRREELARQAEAAARKGRAAPAGEPAKAVESAKAPEPVRAPDPVKAAEPARGPEPKAAEPVKLAAVTPAPAPAPAPAPDPGAASAETLLARGIALEGEGKIAEAVRAFRQAARTGKGPATGQAAKRLGDLLQKKGVAGVSYDYAEALRYYQIARENGVDPGVTKGR